MLLAAPPLAYFTDPTRPNMSAVREYLRVKRDMDRWTGFSELLGSISADLLEKTRRSAGSTGEKVVVRG